MLWAKLGEFMVYHACTLLSRIDIDCNLEYVFVHERPQKAKRCEDEDEFYASVVDVDVFASFLLDLAMHPFVQHHKLSCIAYARHVYVHVLQVHVLCATAKFTVPCLHRLLSTRSRDCKTYKLASRCQRYQTMHKYHIIVFVHVHA